VQAQVEVAKESYEEAKDMATRVIKERFGEDCNVIENGCNLLNEDSVAENARILEGKTLHDYVIIQIARMQLTHLLLYFASIMQSIIFSRLSLSPLIVL
jgi:hypothetical protein